jgi:hypothetical protein
MHLTLVGEIGSSGHRVIVPSGDRNNVASTAGAHEIAD